MIGELFINGKDAFTTWGVGLEDKSVSALMTPAPNKAFVTNQSRLEHGKRVIAANPKKNERDLSLAFHIYAETKEAFFANYNSFCTELAKGLLTIKSAYIPNTTYRMTYEGCTQFAAYNGTLGLFTLKLNEPNPQNRGTTSL